MHLLAEIQIASRRFSRSMVALSVLAFLGETAVAQPKLEPSKFSVTVFASASGGTIRIVPKAPEDAVARDSLRSLGQIFARELPQREMKRLFQIVPAGPQIAQRLQENAITFMIKQEAAAVIVELIASNQLSRSAIHDYFRAAESVSRVETERSAKHPGNNLGWDAPPDSDLRK